MPVVAVLLTGLGLVASYRLARRSASLGSSIAATLAIAAGSPIAWRLGGSQALASGLIVALAGALAFAWDRAGHRQPTTRRAAVAVVIGIAGCAPWLPRPVHALSPELVDVLWSSRGGALATSPLLALGLAGLAALWPLDRARVLAGFALAGTITAAVGASEPWWAGAAPSPLPFVALTPYLVCGLAAGLDALGRAVARRPGLAGSGALALLIAWNIGLVAIAHRGGLRLGEPVSFAEIDAAEARTWHGWIGHPPSYPANLVFAVASGVSPARFDLLRAGRLLASGATSGVIDIGGDDAWLVASGWHAPERDGDRTFRWATASAAIDVPLDHAADLLVAIDLRPFDLANGQVQRLTLRVNGSAPLTRPLVSGWQRVELAVPRGAWRAGVNHVVLDFAVQGRPSDAGGGDTRWLSAAIDRIEIRVSH